jgi:hypothetical protein
VTGADSCDVQQLTAATGVMGSIITDEHPATRPILLGGVGAQLRIYCRYGMDAIVEESSFDELTWNPTAGDWTMRVPCDADNIEWVRASIAKTSPRIKVFDVAEEERSENDALTTATKSSGPIVVDWNIRG